LGSGERFGSVTAIGAVSPPGGDFSEPVTGGTLRITKVFWALDFTLAHRRHYPAINWFMSYSEYVDTLESWYEDVGQDWVKLRKEALSLLKEEEELREIASLVGAEILGDKQRCVFEAAKMCKEYFLLQSALHPIDMNCPISKTYRMLRLILKFYEKAKQAVEEGVSLVRVLSLDVKEDLARMKITRPEEFAEASARIERKLNEQFDQLVKGATGGMTI
jgi:V/A-type H+-transporting ATPase subunit A